MKQVEIFVYIVVLIALLILSFCIGNVMGYETAIVNDCHEQGGEWYSGECVTITPLESK